MVAPATRKLRLNLVETGTDTGTNLHIKIYYLLYILFITIFSETKDVL